MKQNLFLPNLIKSSAYKSLASARTEKLITHLAETIKSYEITKVILRLRRCIRDITVLHFV